MQAWFFLLDFACLMHCKFFRGYLCERLPKHSISQSLITEAIEAKRRKRWEKKMERHREAGKGILFLLSPLAGGWKRAKELIL